MTAQADLERKHAHAQGGTATRTPEAYKKLFSQERNDPECARSTRCIPYPGLRSFNKNEVDIFFARDEQIAALRSAFTGSSGDEPRRVLVVAGGSSSGKSSIIKAGLLPNLNLFYVANPSGGWYVADFRPGKRPLAELVAGMTRMLTEAILDGEIGYDARATKEDRSLTLKILELISTGTSLDKKQAAEILQSPRFDVAVKAEVERRLKPLLYPSNLNYPARATLLLQDFVEGPMSSIDEARKPARTGPPKLLLYIDQFEEIFRDDANGEGVDIAERDAIFELLRYVDQQQPANLFVVLSMRSEELHRCSAYDGIAGIINRSIHLVELVKDRAIRPAILKPAQRMLMDYDFSPNASPTWPFTEEAIHEIEDAYKEAFQHNPNAEADALPQLQHFLRSLWQTALKTWMAHPELAAENQFVAIDSQMLDRVPGWSRVRGAQNSLSEAVEFESASAQLSTPQTRLGEVLNESAIACLRSAYEAWDGTRPWPRNRLGSAEASDVAPRVINAALVSLAGYDSTGRFVRNPLSLHKLVEAARDGSNGATVSIALAAALKRFEFGCLIECREQQIFGNGESQATTEPVYDVLHESLIRSWSTYRRRVTAAQSSRRAIQDLHREIETGSFGHSLRTARALEPQISAALGSVTQLDAHLQNAVNALRSFPIKIWAAFTYFIYKCTPARGEHAHRLRQYCRNTLRWASSNSHQSDPDLSNIAGWASDRWAYAALKFEAPALIVSQKRAEASKSAVSDQEQHQSHDDKNKSRLKKINRRRIIAVWSPRLAWTAVTIIIVVIASSASSNTMSLWKSEIHELSNLANSYAKSYLERPADQDRYLWSAISAITKDSFWRKKLSELVGMHGEIEELLASKNQELDTAIRDGYQDVIIRLPNATCAQGAETNKANACRPQPAVCLASQDLLDDPKRAFEGKEFNLPLANVSRDAFIAALSNLPFPGLRGGFLCLSHDLRLAFSQVNYSNNRRQPFLTLLDWKELPPAPQSDASVSTRVEIAPRYRSMNALESLEYYNRLDFLPRDVSFFSDKFYFGLLISQEKQPTVQLATNRSLSEFDLCTSEAEATECMAANALSFPVSPEPTGCKEKRTRGNDILWRECTVTTTYEYNQRSFKVDVRYREDRCTEAHCPAIIKIYTTLDRQDKTEARELVHHLWPYQGPKATHIAVDSTYFGLVGKDGKGVSNRRIIIDNQTIKKHVSDRWEALADPKHCQDMLVSDPGSLLPPLIRGYMPASYPNHECRK